SSLPDDLYREIFWEIKTHYSQAELIDFAVVGSGTGIGEASLFHREQNFLHPLELTLYHVYEAKRLAEQAPSVGKRTKLFVARSGGRMDIASEAGLTLLDDYFRSFSPRSVDINALPPGFFF